MQQAASEVLRRAVPCAEPSVKDQMAEVYEAKQSGNVVGGRCTGARISRVGRQYGFDLFMFGHADSWECQARMIR